MGEQLGGGEHEGSAHGFGASRIVYGHILGREIVKGEPAREPGAEGGVAGAEIFVGGDFKEVCDGIEFELGLNLFCFDARAGRTEVTDVCGPMDPPTETRRAGMRRGFRELTEMVENA
jgi:hypothetical protein